jgi:hypothetical protein
MKTPSTEKAASANVAARAVSFSAAPSRWPSYTVERARRTPADQGRIANASADRSNEITIDLDRWENEGGRIGRSDGIAATYVLMQQE